MGNPDFNVDCGLLSNVGGLGTIDPEDEDDDDEVDDEVDEASDLTSA